MSVPTFQQILLPLLRLAADGQPHRVSEAIERLAAEFRLTPEDRRELLPSGKQTRFTNRVHWARTHLGKAGYLSSPRHGEFLITARGRDFLQDDRSEMGMADLEKHPEYREFRRSSDRGLTVPEHGAADATTQAPEEVIEANISALNARLGDELLAEVKRRSPAFFENLVIDLLVQMGYGGSLAEAAERLGRSGDGGVDGIIKEDKLGLDVIYVQAKRWEAAVSSATVREFVGSLHGKGAQKGVLITTSRFTADARQYAENVSGMKVVLIDGDQLAQYMIEHDVGVAEVATYRVKRVALDELEYFESD